MTDQPTEAWIEEAFNRIRASHPNALMAEDTIKACIRAAHEPCRKLMEEMREEFASVADLCRLGYSRKSIERKCKRAAELAERKV